MKHEKLSRILLSLVRFAGLNAAILLLAALFKPLYMASGSCNYFLLCVLIGIPFGAFRMIVFLAPSRLGIGESVGVLVLDLLIGGIIGFFAMCATYIKSLFSIVKAVIE